MEFLNFIFLIRVNQKNVTFPYSLQHNVNKR